MKAAFSMIVISATATWLAVIAPTIAGEMDPNTCPMHAEHAAAAGQSDDAGQSFDAMNARGDKTMGFDQAKTIHHFTLHQDGGEISVETRTKDDAVAREQIRTHLKSITTAFGGGDFSMPAAVHAQVVPGTAAMTRLHSEIRYAYEDTPLGGRVRISSGNANAIDAIHDFLRFQIAEHRTGDAVELKR